MKKVLLKNSLFGLAQALTNMLLVFFVIPVFIKKLGSDSYGVFALIMLVGNLNTFTNIGLTNALVKFVSEQGKSEESTIDIVSNLALVILLILPLTFILVFFNKFIIADLIKVPFTFLQDAKLLYYWVIGANFLLFIGQVFKSILDALQKIYITSLQQVIYNLLYWGLVLLALLLGYKLPEIGLAIFVSALIWLIMTIVSAKKEWGKVNLINIKHKYMHSIAKQLKYGSKIYVSGMIGFFYEPVTKILISNFIGLTQVGFYDIALKLRGQLMGIVSRIFYPLFPFLSEQKDITIIRKYVHDLEQKTFLCVVPIIVIAIISMHPFIQMWIGVNVDVVSITSIFIISFHLLGSSTVFPNYQFLQAKDLSTKTIVIQLSNVLFNVTFFFATLSLLKDYSIVAGNVAAIISSFVLSLYYQKKYLNSLIFDSSVQVVKLFSSFVLMIVLGALTKFIFLESKIMVVVSVPFVVSLVALFSYKTFGLVKLGDIERYLGSKSKISGMLAKIYDR